MIQSNHKRLKLTLLAAATIASLCTSGVHAADAFDASTTESYLSSNGYRSNMSGSPHAAGVFSVTSFRESLKQREGNTPWVYDDADTATPHARVRAGEPVKGHRAIGVGHRLQPGDASLFKSLFPGIDAAGVLAGTHDLTQPEIDALADHDIRTAVTELSTQSAMFSQLPGDVQASLVDAQLRHDMTPGSPSVAGPSLDGSISNWQAWEQKSDPAYATQPAVKASVDADAASVNGFLSQKTADALWLNAAVAGAMNFPDPASSMSLSGTANRRAFEVLAAVDDDQNAHFQQGRFLPPPVTTPAFVAAPSSGGFSDVTVARSNMINFTIFDNGSQQDGDVENVQVISSRGTQDLGNFYLLRVGHLITATVGTGAYDLKFTGISQGTAGLDTGEVTITSTVLSGNATQSWRQTVGQVGVIRVGQR